MKRARILMADDHTLVLEGVAKLIENEFEFLGGVEDGHALLKTAGKLHPDVVVMDISMPVLNGVEACRQLLKAQPGVKVIFLSMHTGRVYVQEALRAGGMGYVLKSSAASELSAAIRAVMSGKVYVTSLIEWQGLHHEPNGGGTRDDLGLLTSRQREVLQMVAEGRANKEIAGKLQLSDKTIEFHRSSIKRRLKVKSTAELTQWAIRHGVIGV